MPTYLPEAVCYAALTAPLYLERKVTRSTLAGRVGIAHPTDHRPH
jgi:hypothetical protein